jgi:hypothetical protein
MITLFDFQVKIIPFAAGIALAFLGWILYSIGVATSLLVSWIIAQPALLVPLVIVFGLTGMLLGIFLIRKVHKIVFFFTGLVIGLLLGHSMQVGLVSFGLLPEAGSGAVILFRVLGGIGGGILVLYFNRFIISFLTAFSGSLIMMTSWDFRLGLVPFFPIFFSALFCQLFILRFRRRRDVAK